MKQDQEGQLLSIFDHYKDYGLYNLISGGHGHGLIKLQKISQQIEHDKFCNPDFVFPSLLLLGKNSKTTLAKAFFRSMCFTCITIDADLFGPASNAIQHFRPDKNTGIVVIDVENFDDPTTKLLLTILRNQGKYSLYNYVEKHDEHFEFKGMVILTSSNPMKVNKNILKAVTHVVQLEPYEKVQIELILRQKCKMSGIEIEGDGVIGKIVEQGEGDLGMTLRCLKEIYVVMRAEGRECMTQEDVELVVRLG